jgi:4-amino-4-deoxy-L-arabinose transferase-like glycosyltransferase
MLPYHMRAKRSFYRLSTIDYRLSTIVLLALAYRLILLRTTMATVDSDQSVAGIMARHILRGERPIFFYGQSYNGALEAYLTAVVFRLLGPDDLTLRLVHTLFSVALVAQLYGLARRLYAPWVAVVAGLWLAVPAPMLVWWGTAAGASYIEAAVWGTGLFLIATRRWWLERPRPYDLPALGLLAGLGVWAHPMIAYYLLALAVAALPLAWRRRARFIRALPWRVWPVAAGFALGAAPWLTYTLRHPTSGLTVLAGRPGPYALPDVLWRLATQALPVLVGGAHLSGPADQFARYIAAHPIPYALSLCAIAYLAVRAVLSRRGLIAQARAWICGRPCSDAPLALLLVTVFALYLGSRYKTLSWTTRDPRYLLPLYTCVPYVIACALPKSIVDSRWSIVGRWRMHGKPFPLARFFNHGLSTIDYRLSTILAVALAINIYGAAHYGELPSSTFVNVTPLTRMLVAHGDEAVYGDYWVVWQLAFESGERLIPVVTLGLTIDHNPRGARYAPYLARAAHARRWAYILPDRYADAFIARLRRDHVAYQRWRWGDSSLFYNHWDWGTPNVFEGVGPLPS